MIFAHVTLKLEWDEINIAKKEHNIPGSRDNSIEKAMTWRSKMCELEFLASDIRSVVI